MRFLSMIRADETTGQAPSEQLMADMGQLIAELTRSGQLSVVDAPQGRLHPILMSGTAP